MGRNGVVQVARCYLDLAYRYSSRRVTGTRGIKSSIPIPLAMWKPFARAGPPIFLNGPGTLRIHRERAAVLVCYEKLLVWPVLASIMERPSVNLGIANDYWATGTPIHNSSVQPYEDGRGSDLMTKENAVNQARGRLGSVGLLVLIAAR